MLKCCFHVSLLVVNWRCFSMSKTIERYQKRCKDQGLNGKSEGTNQVCPPFAFSIGDDNELATPDTNPLLIIFLYLRNDENLSFNYRESTLFSTKLLEL